VDIRWKNAVSAAGLLPSCSTPNEAGQRGFPIRVSSPTLSAKSADTGGAPSSLVQLRKAWPASFGRGAIKNNITSPGRGSDINATR
jgi:hypothetical protein